MMAEPYYVINIPKEIENVEMRDYYKSLLYRIGGEDALEAVLEMFVKEMLDDHYLLPFFANVNPAILKLHQKMFLSLAFTKMPSGFDAKAFLIERHYRLFARGLNETHFDRVAVHLQAALNGICVKPALILEVMSRVSPLRTIFVYADREDVTKYFREKIGTTIHLKNADGTMQ